MFSWSKTVLSWRCAEQTNFCRVRHRRKSGCGVPAAEGHGALEVYFRHLEKENFFNFSVLNFQDHPGFMFVYYF